MVVLLDQKGYEFPDAVLRVVDSVLVHGVDYRLKRIVSVGLFRRIEVDDVDFVTKRFKKTVRIMIQFSFWVVCDKALSGKRKSAYRLQYQTAWLTTARCADSQRVVIVRYAGQALRSAGHFSCKDYSGAVRESLVCLWRIEYFSVFDGSVSFFTYWNQPGNKRVGFGNADIVKRPALYLIRHEPCRSVLSLTAWNRDRDVIRDLVCFGLICPFGADKIHHAEQHHQSLQQKIQLSRLFSAEYTGNCCWEIRQIRWNASGRKDIV